MSVNVKENGLLKNVEKKFRPKTFATFAAEHFKLGPSDKKLYLSDEVSAKISTISGIVGGDKWVDGNTYNVGDLVINKNSIYECVGSGGGGVEPSMDSSEAIWKITSLKSLNSKLTEVLVSENVTSKVTVNSAYADNVKVMKLGKLVHITGNVASGVASGTVIMKLSNELIPILSFNALCFSHTYKNIGVFGRNYNTGDISLYTNAPTTEKAYIDIWYIL